MDITPVIPREYNIINGYSKKFVRISNEQINHSFYLTRTKLYALDDFTNINDLNQYEFVRKIDEKPEILIIGTGEKFKQLKSEIKEFLKQYSLKYEIMDNGSAFRTYNILIGEGRDAAVIGIL